MKKTILVASMLMVSSFSWGQATPNQVCQKLSYSPSSAATCAKVISQNRIDQGAVNVAMIIANSSSTETINALNTAANYPIDLNASKVCEKIAGYSPSSAVSCLSAIRGAIYSISAVRVASIIANSSSTEAVNAMKNSANAFIHDGASKTCEKIAGYSPSSAARCLAVIANKDFMNQAESICFTIANSSSTEAVNCLANTAIEYRPMPTPVPVPTDALISFEELRDIKRSLTKARSQIERGMTAQALKNIADAIRTVETVEASNNR